MSYNIDSISNAAMNLKSAVEGLRGAREGEWQDEVSDSYDVYIERCLAAEGRISEAVSKIKNECETLSSIDADALAAQTQAISARLDGI
jgi:hypothetical protein